MKTKTSPSLLSVEGVVDGGKELLVVLVKSVKMTEFANSANLKIMGIKKMSPSVAGFERHIREDSALATLLTTSDG